MEKYESRSELTIMERLALQHILNVVFEGMTWDADMCAYVDNGDIILSLDKAEFQAVKRAYKKL
jgi:hypothetical protein